MTGPSFPVQRGSYHPLDWQDAAECRKPDIYDPDLWFPGDGNAGASYAIEVCEKRCPVRQECLRYALENNEREGIWGGFSIAALTRKQRQKLAS